MTTVYSFLPRQRFRRLAEHVAPRLFIERLLDKFSHREPRLYLRPRAHFRVPALYRRVVIERKALRLMGHGPWEAGNVGDRVVAGDVSAGLAELPVEHAIQPRRLVAIARDGVRDFFWRIESKMPVLA